MPRSARGIAGGGIDGGARAWSSTVGRLSLLALLASLALPALAAQPPPRLVLEDDSHPIWRLVAPPPILGDAEVKEHLATGLTTSFIFRLTTRSPAGDRITGGGRVQVRYELWDEVYHVAAVGADLRVDRAVLASVEELHRWWRSLRLTVLDSRHADLGGTATVRLSLEVVPFSRAEQRDAQRWFSDSLEQQGRSSAEQVGESVDEQPEQLSRAINLLLATSIQRRALVTHQWTLPRPAAAREERR